MADLVIACLSQKGGVGKSTLARLISHTFVKNDWSVLLADFNTRQNTASDWGKIRAAEGVEPAIQVKPFNSPTAIKHEEVDLVVADGKPDSDITSLAIAQQSSLVIIPTGLTFDDLKPQVAFAMELRNKGVENHRILFVLNKTSDQSTNAVTDARNYISEAEFQIAESELSYKIGYQMAQNTGRAISESNFKTLNDRAMGLMDEIIRKVNKLVEEEYV